MGDVWSAGAAVGDAGIGGSAIIGLSLLSEQQYFMLSFYTQAAICET
jgi:hypothetical protein